MNHSTHYIKTSFRHDDYIKDILERAATLTKLSQSELIRNAYLGKYVFHAADSICSEARVTVSINNCALNISNQIQIPLTTCMGWNLPGTEHFIH